MRFARNVRLASLLAMVSAALVLAAPPAWAATISVQSMTGPGILIGVDVQKAVLGITITGSGTFQGVTVDLADVDGDGAFDLSDLQASPDGVAIYADDGTTEDVLDAEDTHVSTAGFSSTGLSLDVTVDNAPVPASTTGFNYFVTVKTSLTISTGDDFTVTIPSPLLGCAFQTSPGTLFCSGGASGTITAETTPPTAQLTTTPTTVDGNVVWTFSEDVVGVSEDNVVLRQGTSTTNLGTVVTYDAGTQTATLNPDSPLAPGSSYKTIVNPASATEPITDAAGNPVAATQATFSLTGVGFTPGVVRGNTWLLSNGPNRVIDTTFKFGKATDFPVAGDWDGDHQWQAGVVRGNVWYLANEAVPQTVTSFAFGKATDYPVVGDWDDNGTYTPGLVRGNKWFVSNQIPPVTLTSFNFASATDFPVVGDWDGNGSTTPGVVRGNVWYVTNQILPVTVTSFAFGKATDYPIAGDWNDDLKWTAGLVRGDVWFLANEPLPQTVTSFTFGEPTDFPVVGDWDGPITGGSAGAGLVPKLVPGS